MANQARQHDPFAAQFMDWAKGEVEEAAMRLRYVSLRKACREKLNARISYLNQAIARLQNAKPPRGRKRPPSARLR